MTKRFLLTSFDIWLSHQESNSADDLLEIVCQRANFPYSLIFLRRLPVDISLASSQVIAEINRTQPDFVIACGMAASRHNLSLEENATNWSMLNSQSELVEEENCHLQTLYTQIDLAKLVAIIPKITLSYDCGKFVCEGLYYSILDYLKQQKCQTQCLFVHVPILTEENRESITDDFLLMIHQLALLAPMSRH